MVYEEFLNLFVIIIISKALTWCDMISWNTNGFTNIDVISAHDTTDSLCAGPQHKALKEALSKT